MKKFLKKGGKFLASLIGLFALLVVWQLAAMYTSLGNIFPTPIAVIKWIGISFVTPIGRHTMGGHLLYSLRRVMTGFILGSVVGIFLGLIIGRSRMGEAIIRPLLEMIRPIPSIAWIPLAILWFGINDSAKIFIIFMAAFGGLAVQTYTGAKLVDRDIMGAAYMLGASEQQTFTNIVLPFIVPYIFTGLQGSLAGSWMAVLAAEMVSGYDGLGWVIMAGQSSYDMTQVLGGIVMISVVGLLLSTLMHTIERILCRWRVKGV